MEDLAVLSAEELHAPNSFLVMFNGRILGKHRHPQVSSISYRKGSIVSYLNASKFVSFVVYFTFCSGLPEQCGSFGGLVKLVNL